MAKRVRPRPEFAQQVRLAEQLRKFEYPDLDTKPPAPRFGGGASTIDVAAHNAPEWEKEGARYICDGVDDHIEIQLAIEEHFSAGVGKGSETTLSSGDFYVDNGWIFVLEQHHLRGQGVFSTRIRHQEAGSTDHQEALINVQQDSELSDLGFITFDTFEGICVTNNYGIVHDLVHFGTAHCFIFFRGTIHMSSSLDSWANYGSDNPDPGFSPYASMLAFDEGWHSVANVSFNGNGTGIWVNAFGHATLTGVQITNGLVNVEPEHPSPGIVLADVGGLTLSDVAIRAPYSSAIESQGYSGDVQISNAVLYGAYGLKSADGWGIGWLHMDNVAITATTSGIEVDDIDELTISGLTIKKSGGGGGIPILPGYGARFSVALDTRKLAISDFIIGGFEEDGLVVGPWTSVGAGYLNIHDGLIEDMQKHGVVIEGGRPTIHDVVVKNVGLGAANTYDGFQFKGTMDTPRLEDNSIVGASQLRYGYNIADATVVRAIVVGNSGGDPSDFGTDALNDQGTDTQLDYPSDATYGDNFFRSGSSSGAEQIEPVGTASKFTFNPNVGEREEARQVVPVQTGPAFVNVGAVTEPEEAQAVAPPNLPIFVDDWTGTDSDPWNASKWTTSVVGSATVDIQSNEGRFQMNGNQTKGRAIADHSPISDSEVLVKVRGTVLNNNLHAFITLRGDGQWSATEFQEWRPQNGYFLSMQHNNTGTVVFQKNVDGTTTNVGGSTSFPWSTAAHWVRVEVVDSGGDIELRAKIWLATDPEPGSWTLSVTETGISHASGVLQLSGLRSTFNTQSIFWDDLTLTDLS